MGSWPKSIGSTRAKLLIVLAAVLLIKFVFLLLDSAPAYFYGDSEAYLAVAVLKWIPPDRSFMYGLLIRRVALHMHSLEAMILLQVSCSSLAAWLLCVALLREFRARFWVAGVFAILCAVEPLQLLMERYIMTESVSNFLFAAHFVLLLGYLKRGSLWMLLTSQAVGVVLIGIRISFLPEVLMNSVLVPLLSPHAISAFRCLTPKALGHHSRTTAAVFRKFALHLFLCLLVSQGLISAYKRWYGFLGHREPALFYQNGAFLLADFAPLIELRDFPTQSRGEAILKRVHFSLTDPQYRPAHHFLEGGLWHAVQAEYQDADEANKVAIVTATRALLRRPFRAAFLAGETFFNYFNPHAMHDFLLLDEGYGGHLDPIWEKWLPSRFGVTQPRSYQLTITKRWHLLATPWYWLVLCTMAGSPLLLFLARRSDLPSLLLIVMTALVFLEGAILTVDRPTPRFLTTDAWLALLFLGVTVERLAMRIGVRHAERGGRTIIPAAALS